MDKPGVSLGLVGGAAVRLISLLVIPSFIVFLVLIFVLQYQEVISAEAAGWLVVFLFAIYLLFLFVLPGTAWV